MTDSNRDTHSHSAHDTPRINTDDAPLAPGVHDISDSGSHASADVVAEPEFDDKPSIPGGSSRGIVLQRLSPQGSWDDLGAARDASFAAGAPLGLGSASERRSLSMAAIVIIAAGIGAVCGGLASAGAGYFLAGESAKTAAADQNHAIELAIAKLNTDLAALKSSGTAQSGKIIDRMERIEKLAKLSEAVDKMRAPEITGSIAAPSSPTPAATAAPPNRLPVVSDWVLRDVGEGAARVEGRLGVYEVYPGDPLPGLGRVDAIRRQDGHWAVVTSRGLILAR
jgi:hypothetical protein